MWGHWYKKWLHGSKDKSGYELRVWKEDPGMCKAILPQTTSTFSGHGLEAQLLVRFVIHWSLERWRPCWRFPMNSSSAAEIARCLRTVSNKVVIQNCALGRSCRWPFLMAWNKDCKHGGQHSTMVSILLNRPSCPGFDYQHSLSFLRGKNCRCCWG